MRVDYLVVGSGLTGATIARVLADAGREVLVVERRSHAGGNVHDHAHPSGIRVHTYGPHYFRTSSDRIWAFANRFATFYKYEAQVKAHVDGAFENWPVAASYIARTLGPSWKPDFRGIPATFEEACLSFLPGPVYEAFVKGYTEKQWGVPASSLSPELASRFDLRTDDDPRLTRHPYQGLPEGGYAAWMEALLRGIPVLLNLDYLQCPDRIQARRLLIFTGGIDEFFGYRLGRLRYRAQMRVHTYLPELRQAQPCVQLNNPSPQRGTHIRTIEWKHLMPRPYGEQIAGTVLTRETPFSPTDPDSREYPFPDGHSAVLFQAYARQAAAIDKLLICGRLGDYRYYDMDHAIGRALELASRILDRAGKAPRAVERREPVPAPSGAPAGEAPPLHALAGAACHVDAEG